MRISPRSWQCALALLCLSLFLAGFLVSPSPAPFTAAASTAGADPASLAPDARPLGEFLNPDGTLNLAGAAAREAPEAGENPGRMPAPTSPSQLRGCRAETRLLPIAANEYWEGSNDRCPYDNCGPPYSFVRDPAQEAPFRTEDQGLTWIRNVCIDNPYNHDTCQGPYEGRGENFGKAFALLGADAKPISGPMEPRGGVMLDCRYDALVSGGAWVELVSDNTWLFPGSCPISDGEGADEMIEVIRQGGYHLVPQTGTVSEPPPQFYTDTLAYCWSSPPNEDNCFNWPERNRAEPYEALQFLSGARCAQMVYFMYDDGNYVGGRYAPGQSIIAAVYNGYILDTDRNTAVLVGYFRAIIVGYGNDFDWHCEANYSPTPGDWQSYVPCIAGQPNTLYAIADLTGPLVLDPTPYLPLPNQAPEAPYGPTPADGAAAVPLTATLSWLSLDPDGDPVTYTVAFGPVNPPPVVSTDTVTPTLDPGPLECGTTYYWSVSATDGCTTTTGPVWSFTTEWGRPPTVPSDPLPADGATGVPLVTALHWLAFNPGGDPLTYTVAFGAVSPPPVVSTTIVPSFAPGPLLPGTTYYWAITATNGCMATAGPAWSFTTRVEVQEWRVYLPVVCRLEWIH